MLLQGPTSAGKTSLIQYLARLTGHKCLRINNHEHTDLQEYVGMYSANAQGQLEFQEGKTCTWHTVNTTSGSKELVMIRCTGRGYAQWSLGHP